MNQIILHWRKAEPAVFTGASVIKSLEAGPIVSTHGVEWIGFARLYEVRGSTFWILGVRNHAWHESWGSREPEPSGLDWVEDALCERAGIRAKVTFVRPTEQRPAE